MSLKKCEVGRPETETLGMLPTGAGHRDGGSEAGAGMGGCAVDRRPAAHAPTLGAGVSGT